jgi:hypothetical protein
MNEEEIELVLKKDSQVEDDPDDPKYTRLARRHLSLETLKQHHIDYEFDADPDYIVFKRWIPEHEQNFLWNHTKELRQKRAQNAEAIAPSNCSAGSRRSSGVIELPETAEEEEQRQEEEMEALYQVRMAQRRELEEREERRKLRREARERGNFVALRELRAATSYSLILKLTNEMAILTNNRPF